MFKELNSKKLDQTISVLEKNYYALSSMLACKVLTEEQIKEQMLEIRNILNYLYCVK